MSTWKEHWALTFPPRLSELEVSAFEEIIMAKVPNVTGAEIKQAIDTLAESGRYDSFGSKPHQLRSEIMRHRNDTSDRGAMLLYKHLVQKIKREQDPVKRWEIICEETPPNGDISERLENWCVANGVELTRFDMSDVAKSITDICNNMEAK